MNKPVVMIIMDGIGLTQSGEGNAVHAAYTPTLDMLMKNHPNIAIKAHGTAVGLPSDDDMGNSEVGHNALGCGQVYSQGAKLVNESIESGLMYSSETWGDLVKNVKSNDSTMHFIGLLSDGNVHSNIGHLKNMVTEAKKQGIKTVRAHVLLDGRDVPSQSALEYIDELEALFASLNNAEFNAKIASGGGRMKITMDRYGADWEMVRRGWNVHVHGVGEGFSCAKDAVLAARQVNADLVDQDIPPFVITENDVPVGKIQDNDSVVLFNFRGDRAIEISQAFDDEVFTNFDRSEFGKRPNVLYAGMLQYDGDMKLPSNYLVSPPNIKGTLSEVLAANNVRQYAVSETQKYGHVTYFWNGNRNEKFSEELEEFCEIPSDRVSFDEKPWMKAAEVTEKVIEAMRSGQYGFIRANFPNGDMVGHTGNYAATVIAVETVDLCLARLVKVADECGAVLLITADHGNADEMFEKTKAGSISPKTAHTLNPVPFIIYEKGGAHQLKQGDFGLANAAATVTQLLGLKPLSVWEEGLLN